ncbi:MAG TPA: hypothetical protein VMV77_01720 [Bacteroidales bacterium]|nr:hypothetical protein [Bacteroidales bacterium]
MAMNPGNKEATTGLAKVIYDAEQAHKERISPPALTPYDPKTETAKAYQERVVEAIDNSNRERAYDISNGIIEHFKDNAEIKGVATNVNTVVGFPIPVQVAPATGTGGTTAAGAGSGSGTQNNSGIIE